MLMEEGSQRQRGAVSLWADSHFSLLPVLPLVTSSCVETYKDVVCTWHVQQHVAHVDNNVSATR